MKYLITYILIGISLLSCSKDFDNEDKTGSTYEGKDTDLRVRDFIWKGLNTYYLWQADVANLQDTRFGSLAKTKAGENNTYTSFLKSFADPEALFYKGLLYNYGTTDRFSYIVEDYTKLENQFKGISASTGMDNAYVRVGGSSYVIGLVRYVVPNSDADKQGLKRGDIFISINGSPITPNNIEDLLKSSTYAFDVYRFTEDGSDIEKTGRSVTLHNTETPENPVLVKKVITQRNRKIAYLMYTAFIADFNEALNTAFAEFKAAGATDLVLDLRYNGGGSVETAVYLASMITGQFTGQVFAKEKWNAKMQPVVDYQNSSYNYFTDKMKNGTAINSLGLKKVYIITSGCTASASELVINGLKPYVEVVQIGDTTIGKNQGSITIYDYTDTANRVKNTKHKWAMQPLVMKIENAKGEGDYVNGLTPTIKIKENIRNLIELGDTSEPLLAKALEQIAGTTATGRVRALLTEEVPSFEVIGTSKGSYLGYNEMYK